jgi:hypothetical protein
MNVIAAPRTSASSTVFTHPGQDCWWMNQPSAVPTASAMTHRTANHAMASARAIYDRYRLAAGASAADVRDADAAAGASHRYSSPFPPTM